MPRARLSSQQQAIRRGGEDSKRKVLYTTHIGPQTEFMTSQAEELLYGGAKGGGKSHALRAWAVTYCMSYPGAKVALFRQSFRQLEETHIINIQQEVPSSIATYSSGNHNLIFNNGSILFLRFCEKDEDARTYDTAEFDALLFDELTHFTEFQYTYLISRCRSVNSWWPGRRIRSGATPLGRGHVWVKARWKIQSNQQGQLGIWKAPLDEGGLTRQFIPAKVTDNTALMDADPDYVDALRTLPSEEYRAAMGDWNTITGQYFSRWDDSIHIVKPFDIDIEWDRFICVDYGYNKPYSVNWFARVPNSTTVYVYREQYGTNIPLSEQVYRAWQVVESYGEKIKAVILDPSLFSKVNVKGERTAPMAEDWKASFSRICPVVPGNNDRISGWRLMREMIDWKERPDGGMLVSPRIYFFNTCENAIRTIPALICDKNNIEDIDTDGEDHTADALRYGLRFAFEGRGRPGLRQSYRIGPKGIASSLN